MEKMDSYEKMLKSLPKALPEEEQQKYIDIFYRNADKNSEEALKAREKLIVCNLRLVSTVINRNFYLSRTPKDEMFSCGVQWLINAIDSFDIEKGYALSTYLVSVIKNGIIRDYVVTNRHLVPAMSLDEPVINDAEEDVATYKDFVQDPDDFVEDVHRKVSNEYFIKKLDLMLNKRFKDYQVDMLYRHVGIMGYKEQTLEEIGDRYGMTRERVRQIITKEFNFIKTNVLDIKEEKEKEKEKRDERIY